MQATKKIRIIKRTERDVQPVQTEVAGAPVSVSDEQKEVSSPDAVKTITGWINELRQKKHAELATAFAFKNSLTQPA